MRTDIRRRHDAHVRVNGVCTEHSALFDATQGGQKTRAALGTCVSEEARLLAAQTEANEDRRASAEDGRVARLALRNATKAIVKVGRLVHLDEITMTTMRVPRAASDDELIADARGLLNRVSPHADGLVAAGLPLDVLKNLDAAIQDLTAARDTVASARQRFTAATAAIRDAQSEATRTIAALEAIASNLPTANPELVIKLRIAKRVGPHADTASKQKPAPAPTPPSTTPTIQPA